MNRKGIANDPERKARIAQAALDLIAEGGIKAATYRKIAVAAAVPLGSVTYHYTSMDHILVEAFTLFGNQLDPRYGIAIASAPTQMDARDVLVDAICGERRATQRELRLFREMYAYGSTSPRVQDLVRSFEARSISALKGHFAEPAARAIDALVEGWWIYQSWTPGGLEPHMVRDAIDALADKFADGPGDAQYADNEA
ncbi:TetR/AcrR family transcriptional regulator [Acidipropionibacterium virtanenii]|uniref:HTH-type transcriptional regulator RcdA n=1 Tax=Acidipropionibacterium virtanenii TaxID=2057246 RepID=A0A344UXM2_9ACTN|nr:TetR family transcriptional regulator [Acidipropionibacterium virtanenii]AXE40020.1 HTH-type transcriptional regulator RcdA [Acidipropionibacterium virtanenii]